MDSELRIDERPTLRRPILIAAFKGWNDGGQGASSAAEHLVDLWDAKRFAEIDPELFLDFQAVRPNVVLEEGTTRRIEWPENAFYHAPIPGLDRDAVILLGVEPSYRWRTFVGLVTGLAQELGVEMVVSLGALLADVPHTRPSPVTGSASDPQLVEQLGLQLSRYEGPTGIVGVLHDGFQQAGVGSVSLWAAVPHYVSLAPSPRAARALCERLGDLLGMPVDVEELVASEEDYAAQVSAAVSSDAETQSYVEELERRADTLDMLIEADDLPTGESLAAELTRYLREHERRRGDDGGEQTTGGDG
jgi:proteasome assembly chaperone (PAC2) family protein